MGQRGMGNHNHANGRTEESEGFIVALKRGNARGVKGPHCKYVEIAYNQQPLESEALHQGTSPIPARRRYELTINTLPDGEADEERNPNRVKWVPVLADCGLVIW
jgi:hypothetical protein